MARGRLWTREELILALSVYKQIPFGRMNDTTPEVIDLARLINRSPNTVAIRLGNFAACDPYILASGRKGMSGGVNTCKPIWDEFYGHDDDLFLTAQQIKSDLLQVPIEKTIELDPQSYFGKEREALIKQRINQGCFRAMILNNYELRCAITGINIPTLLVASHIIPWADRDDTRLDPDNGICLSSLYDKTFDKGLITINADDYAVVLSSALMEYNQESFFDKHFASIDGYRINLPIEHSPSREYLDYHNKHIFLGR